MSLVTYPLHFLLIFGLGLSTAGCGLHPIYGQYRSSPSSKTVISQMARITVEPIADRTGQQLRTLLQENFDAAKAKSNEEFTTENPGYQLLVTVNSSPFSQGDQIDNTTSYGILLFKVKYKLLSISNRKSIFERSFVVHRNFALPLDGFSEMISISDAQKLAMTQISQTIIENLHSYFDQLPGK